MDYETLLAPRFADISSDCARFQRFCDRDIKLHRDEPGAESHCVLWHGPMGSKSMRPPHTHTHILDTVKITSDLRFQAQGKQVSARVYAYMAVHGKDAVSSAIQQGRERLRLSSSCRNYRCVNPWHHFFKKKITTAAAERIIKPEELSGVGGASLKKKAKKSTIWHKFTSSENS